MSVSPAIAVPAVPGSANPAQIEKRFQQPEAPLESPDLKLPVPGQPELSPKLKAELAKKQFVLKSVVFEGVTAYKPEDLKFSYEELLGKKISLLDAEVIAQRVTELYRHDGYILSQAVVPPQDVADGVLKIRVVEGYIGNVIIQGNLKPGEHKIIESYAENIKKTKPIRTQDLERYLLLMNDLPGATVKGLLRPSPTQFAAADLVLTMTRTPFEGSYSVDNRGSKPIGPWQHTAAVSANSLFGIYDRTQLRLITTTPATSELQAIDLQHEEMLGSEGTKLTLLGSHTHTEPAGSIESLQIVGDSDLLEAKVTHPFIRSRQENLSARALFDFHNTVTDIFKNQHYTEDRLRVARIGGNYTLLDKYAGSNFLDAQVSQGLNIIDPSESGTDRSNPNGASDFTKLNMDLSRVQTLPYHFSVLAAGSAQYAFNPLLLAEQFSLGGADYGRAYDPATLLGDDGLAGKLELRYGQSVNTALVESYQLYSFYDVGRVWLRTGTNPENYLSSVGGGVRANFMRNLSGNLELGVPLAKAVNTQTGYGSGPRIFGSITGRF